MIESLRSSPPLPFSLLPSAPPRAAVAAAAAGGLPLVAAAHNGRLVKAKRQQQQLGQQPSLDIAASSLPVSVILAAPPRGASAAASAALGASLSLPLESNLLAASRAALCPGLDPLAALLATLRGRFGRAATFHADAEAAGEGGGGSAPVIGVVWAPAAAQSEQQGPGEGLLRALAFLESCVAAGAGLVAHAELRGLPPHGQPLLGPL